MSTNARIRDITAGVTAEMIADKITAHYAPLDQTGAVIFDAHEVLFVGTTPEAMTGAADELAVTFADLAPRLFGAGLLDPVTQQPLDNVSGAGVEMLFRAAYDILYNERAAAAAAQEPTP